MFHQFSIPNYNQKLLLHVYNYQLVFTIWTYLTSFLSNLIHKINSTRLHYKSIASNDQQLNIKFNDEPDILQSNDQHDKFQSTKSSIYDKVSIIINI